jgi:hypothetical protein
MSTLAEYRHLTGRSAAEGLLYFVLLVLLSLAVTALGFVGYALWPSWPDADVALDAPALPITVGGAVFNVPPQAIRIAAQRRSGAQERIDLVYLWPSLAPPDPNGPAPNLAARDRVFVTIAATTTAMSPVERLKTIYPRYIGSEPTPAPAGLALFAFRDGSPYQGEDVAFDAEAPDRFLARCTRTVNPLTPGTCLAERRLGDADLTVRFPRDWLASWRDVEAGLDKLVAQLQPAGR